MRRSFQRKFLANYPRVFILAYTELRRQIHQLSTQLCRYENQYETFVFRKSRRGSEWYVLIPLENYDKSEIIEFSSNHSFQPKSVETKLNGMETLGKILSKLYVYITTSSSLSKISKTFSVSTNWSGRKCCSICYLRVENLNWTVLLNEKGLQTVSLF